MKIFLIVLLLNAFTVAISQNKNGNQTNPMVTFIEVGSVTCTSCKLMMKIIGKIEEKYEDQIIVRFYDVNKPDQKMISEKYGVKLIPTQIFLDENDKEFFRHEGFFPEKEIDKLLKSKGLKPLTKKKK